MDRQMLTYVAVTIIFLTLIGGWYLSPSKPRLGATAVSEESTEAAVEPAETRRYSPEDVRFKFAQKAKKQGKRGANPAPEEPSPAPESSENEAPPIDDGGDESAEAPPIE